MEVSLRISGRSRMVHRLDIALASLFLFWVAPAMGQESLRSLLQCDRLTEAQSVSPTAYLRSFAFKETKSIEVPSQGTSLLSFLAQNDSISVAIARLQRIAANANAADLPFFVGEPDLDNVSVVLHLRANAITLFPRAILIHPAVSMARLKPGDVVATFELNASSFVRKADELDPAFQSVRALNQSDSIHRWFHDQIARRSEQGVVTIRLGGERIKAEARGERQFSHRFSILAGLPIGPITTQPPATTNLAFAVDSHFNSPNDLALEKEITGATSKNELLLYVVSRKVGRYLVRYIVPAKNRGAFSPKGDYYQKLFGRRAEETRESTSWRFEPFLQLPLVEGDSLQVTSMRSVPLFVERAPLISVE